MENITKRLSFAVSPTKIYTHKNLDTAVIREINEIQYAKLNTLKVV